MKFDTWLSRLRTRNTRECYAIYVKKFFGFHKVTPQESLAWDSITAEDRLEDFKHHMLEEGYAGKTVSLAWIATKRWFEDHRIPILKKLRDVSTEKTYVDYIPTKPDLQKMLDDSILRYKLAICLMAHAGLRPVDVAELQYQHVKSSVEKNDMITTIIKKHRKTRQWYFSFLGQQGTRLLVQQIELHKKRGLLNDDCFIVSKEGTMMRPATIGDGIREIIYRTVGKSPTGEPFRKFRPYGLRKYFRRALSALDESVAEFLMGHYQGLRSLTATYSGLRDMDPVAIETLKQQYISVLPELETEVTDESIKAQLAELKEKEGDLEKAQADIAALQKALKALQKE